MDVIFCDRKPLFLYADEEPATFRVQCESFRLGIEKDLIYLVKIEQK